MRSIKIALGIILVLVGLYVLVGERLAGSSSDATLNARLVSIRAPIDGELTLMVRSAGVRVNTNESLADIADNRYDNIRLLELERAQELQKTEAQRLRTQTQALTSARATLQGQSDNYQSGRVRQIQSRFAEARATLESSHARLREAESSLKRTTELSGRGVQTAITLDRATANYEVAIQDEKSASQRVDYLETELNAAKQGVFLGDSYNDTPFSLQRIRELDLRLSELQAEQRQADERVFQGNQQIAAERIRLNRLTEATISAQTPGLVWNVLSDTGEYVRRGQDLMQIAECASLRITASVSEGLYNSLEVGEPAQFRLYGDDRVFTAVVARLGGAGAGSLYANLAVAPSVEHLRRFDVSLIAPDVAKHPDLQCAIGRTGRLLFTSGPLSALKHIATRFGF